MKNNGAGLARSVDASARYESISPRNAGTIWTRCADATRRAAFGKPSAWVSWSMIFAEFIRIPPPKKTSRILPQFEGWTGAVIMVLVDHDEGRAGRSEWKGLRLW
jgi:hypothetical protein